MGTYIYKIVLAFLLLSFFKQYIDAKIIPVYPPNGSTIEESLVNFKWEDTDGLEYIYQHGYSFERYFETTMTRGNLLNPTVTRGLNNGKIYYWRIKYHPKNTFEGLYENVSDVFVFSINKEIPEDVLQEFVNTNTEEDEIILEENVTDLQDEKKEELQTLEQEEEKEEETTQQEDLPFLGNNSSSPATLIFAQPLIHQIVKEEEPQNELNWNIYKSIKSTFGISSTSIVCKFKYQTREEKILMIFCDIPKLHLTEQKKYLFGNDYSIIVNGTVSTTFNIQIDEYICDFNLLKPSTWFRCEEKFKQSKIIKVTPNMFFHIYKDDIKIPILSYVLNGNSFGIVAGHIKNDLGVKMVHKFRIVNSEYNLFYDEENEYPLALTDYDSSSNDLKLFRFPFENIIGVTQWYGYTDYQSPHTGIDFGAYKESILAVGNGEVVSIGWDSYFGECLSGGNYVKIKQDNRIYTVYFHLEEIYVNTGDIVIKGQNIGKSGNTGAWNCQKLAHHLHFETRLNSSSSSHSNPVKYINTDWSKVPTLGYLIYPGRLSGENPHPGR